MACMPSNLMLAVGQISLIMALQDPQHSQSTYTTLGATPRWRRAASRFFTPYGEQFVVSDDIRSRPWPSIALNRKLELHRAAASTVQSNASTSSPFFSGQLGANSSVSFLCVENVYVANPVCTQSVLTGQGNRINVNISE